MNSVVFGETTVHFYSCVRYKLMHMGGHYQAAERLKPWENNDKHSLSGNEMSEEARR